MPTITFNNQSSTTAVAVLDPEFGLSSIPTTVPKYFSSVSLTNLTNISEDKIVVNDYKIGVVVPPGNSSFEFTPSISLPPSDVIIRGAGDCSVVYQDGATTINITAEELNNPTANPTPPPPPPSYNNQFSFLFDPGLPPYPTPGILPRFSTPQNAGLSPTNNFTLSVWVKPLISDPPDDGTIFDNANSSNGYILMHDDFNGPSGPNGRWNFQIQKSGQGVERIRTNISPIANTWQNVLAVFSDGTGSIYVNGVKRGSGSFGSSTTIGVNTTQDPYVGTSQGTSAGTIDPYSGSLQNMSLWNTAFTQAEINELYNGGTPTDLNEHTQVLNGIAWWQFGGNGESGSFAGNWTELNCFNNAQYPMTSTNMVLADQVADVPT